MVVDTIAMVIAISVSLGRRGVAMENYQVLSVSTLTPMIMCTWETIAILFHCFQEIASF